MSPGHPVPCSPAKVVFALCLASRHLQCIIVEFKCGRSSLFKFENNIITEMVAGAEGPTRAYGLVPRPYFAGERSTWSQVGRVQQQRRHGGVVGAAFWVHNRTVLSPGSGSTESAVMEKEQ